ncbi:MAG: c-type cytochrome [Acidobacteria bacterium]|nr:c-type cytochrome [Acidobacteriota bacterium]
MKRAHSPGRRWSAPSLPARHYAAWSVLVLGCALVAGHAQSTAPKKVSASQASANSSAGKQTFESICAPCHGLNGRGGERAPDIAMKRSIVRMPDAQLLKVLQEGKPQAGMPAFGALGPEKLAELLRYLRLLQGKRDSAAIVTADAEHGKALYAGKAGCGECHMVNGRGGFLGPDLSDYGANHSAGDIRHSILSADSRPALHKTLARITTKEGQQVSGLVRNEDNFSLQLQSLDGAFHLLEKNDVAELTWDPLPIMPGDYGAKLSQEELNQLVAYLASLTEAKP